VAYFYLGIGLLVLSALVLRQLLESRFGIAFRGVRDAEIYASTLGIGIFRVKIVAFTIASLFIGLSGAFLTMFYGAIGLNILDTSNMLLFFSMVVIGGLGTFLGPIAGAFILVPLDLYFTTFGPGRLLIWGAAILIVVLVAPDGVVGRAAKIVKTLAARRTKG
jgi:ABC-type branched-subunit amino acid transport system permease subunit